MGNEGLSESVVAQRLSIPPSEIVKGRDAISAWMRTNRAHEYDLSGQSLVGMDLTELDLSKCNLSGCNLQRAIMQRVNLRGARLDDANMDKVNLRGSDLSGASLVKTTLTEADLEGEDVVLTSFSERNAARDRGTFTVRRKLRRTTLDGADLRSAILFRTRLRHATLKGANLEGANLQQTDLRDCDLRGAKANSATSMHLAVVENARFSKFTLASMNGLGGLTEGELGTAIIEDDVAKLRASYSGFWQWIHLIALSLFLSPYVAFVIEQWIKSRFLEVLLPRERITLGAAVVRYALTGVSPVSGPWSIDWTQVLMFGYLLSYNVLRIVMLFKTKNLELNEHVMGLPRAFHLRGGWAAAYEVLKWGMIGNVIIVLIHTFKFLQQEVYVF